MVLALEMYPERQCANCTTRNKETWGCEKDTQFPVNFDGEEFTRCPRRPLLDDGEFYGEVLWLYRNYERGVLPDEGALDSQPDRLVRMFRLIEHYTGLCRREKAERNARLNQ